MHHVRGSFRYALRTGFNDSFQQFKLLLKKFDLIKKQNNVLIHL